MAAKFSSWVHGHSVVVERAVTPHCKDAVDRAFVTREWDGDLVDLRDFGTLAVSRIGSGAQFVVFDHGIDDNPKSGLVWCHYSVPTPVMVGGLRSRLNQVYVKHTTNAPQQLAITAVHVWDGPERRFQRDNIVAMDPNFQAPLVDDEVLFGIGVSLLLSANNAQNVAVTVHAVGVDFMV
jgi:hypothetical protein